MIDFTRTTARDIDAKGGGASLTEPEVLAKLAKLDVRARGLVEGTFSGMHKSPHRGASVEFAQYREYVQGDDISNIDWRVYARSDRFYIKEFEADTNLRCHLMVDASASMGYPGPNNSKLLYAKKLAATLAHLLIRQSDAVGLQCFNEKLTQDIPTRTSARHLGAILSVLNEITPSGGTRLVKILHDLAEKVRRRALIIVFSDLFTDVEELLDCFQHMRHRKHDLAVFHLMAPDELSFDFDRSTRFVDLESAASLVTEPAIIKQEYLNELNSYLDRMKKGCAEFQTDYRLVDTTTPYDQTLSDFLLERRR
ncbi:MAG: DUF58 domain-containing protein [Kiritimatiellaeota bacterium]|nr:DUF58 domain-containing protein [Kiritimatiellota bacterium]